MYCFVSHEGIIVNLLEKKDLPADLPEDLAAVRELHVEPEPSGAEVAALHSLRRSLGEFGRGKAACSYPAIAGLAKCAPTAVVYYVTSQRPRSAGSLCRGAARQDPSGVDCQS